MTALAGYDAKIQDETRALKNEYVNDAIEKSGQDPREITPEQYEQIEREAEAKAEKDYTEQTGKRYQEPRRAGEERANEQTYSYNGAPTTGGSSAGREDSSPRTSGEPSPNPNRPGANAEVNSWEGKAGQREPDSVRYAREAAERRNAGTQGSSTGTGGTTGGKYDAGVEKGTGAGSGSGTGTGSGNGSGSGSGSGSGNGKNKDVPDGSTYHTPSYGQGGKVVKAPYKKGGYTEDELKKMGNNSWGTRYGKNVYEGYYEWEGRYYPIDQIKANYYREHGSYSGWNEGMRDYWNTFGTFYGYRPGWRVDGRLGGGGGYSYGGRSGGGYSYGGGSSSSGGGSRSGGATANNGLYWNGNTSWNI